MYKSHRKMGDPSKSIQKVGVVSKSIVSEVWEEAMAMADKSWSRKLKDELEQKSKCETSESNVSCEEGKS